MKVYKKAGYKLTESLTFQNEEFEIDEKLNNQLEDLFYEAQDENDPNVIAKLEGLVQEYPKAPMLKNFLAEAYRQRELFDKQSEICDQIIAEHPGYLYGRLMKANSLLVNEEYDKIPELLGAELDIRKLFPDREVFHLKEVSDLAKFSIFYYLKTGEISKAKQKYKELEKVYPDHPELDSLFMHIEIEELGGKFAKLTNGHKCRNTVAQKKVEESGITAAPVFHHPEIEELYQYNSEISPAILQNILSLPRTSLIADLELVLADSVKRFYYFSEAVDEMKTFFPLHAYFLLADLRAEESLDTVLSVLEYDHDFLDFWFGDYLTEFMWIYFYKIGFSKIETLKEFLYNPQVTYAAKTAITEAMTQTILHDPAQKETISAILEEFLNQFVRIPEEEAADTIEPEFIAILVGCVIDAKLKELLPVVQELYDKDYVDISLNGDYEEVLYHIKDTHNRKKEAMDIYPLYQYANKLFQPHIQSTPAPPPISSVKTGRNDPCPCGSGKKYKKCCLGK